MARVRVVQHIAGDIDAVFGAISDHETFLGRSAGMRARVVTPGKPERNGLGCVREILAGKRLRYLEEITAWTRPVSFEYLILESSVPIRHHGSRLEFASASGGTEVTWTSHYDASVPVTGWVLGWYLKDQYENAFKQLLRDAGARFESGRRKVAD